MQGAESDADQDMTSKVLESEFVFPMAAGAASQPSTSQVLNFKFANVKYVRNFCNFAFQMHRQNVPGAARSAEWRNSLRKFADKLNFVGQRGAKCRHRLPLPVQRGFPVDGIQVQNLPAGRYVDRVASILQAYVNIFRKHAFT